MMMNLQRAPRSITARLSGDLAAAIKVDLVLPSTGVCSTLLAEKELACCA